MIEISNVDTFGWEAAIRGMRNPMNSWDKSDTVYIPAVTISCDRCSTCPNGDVGIDDCLLPHIEDKWGNCIIIGENDLSLMKKLVKAGSDHSKFMRMINITADINAPLYWWKEYDTYKVGTVANSCSTMHKIHAKEFTLDDFSHENIHDAHGIQLLLDTIDFMNEHRKWFIAENDPNIKKDHWWNMIQMLPSSYNQKRTVQLNYAVARNMYHGRNNHKLDEWNVDAEYMSMCKFFETLPYSELITEV